MEGNQIKKKKMDLSGAATQLQNGEGPAASSSPPLHNREPTLTFHEQNRSSGVAVETLNVPSTLQLTVNTAPLQQLLEQVIAVVHQQQSQINALRDLLMESEKRREAETAKLRKEFEQRLGYTVDHVATAMDAVRRETVNACQRAFPDAQAIPAIIDRLHRTEVALEAQRQLNAQHHVDYVALSGSVEGRLDSGDRQLRRGRGEENTAPNTTSDVEQLRRDVDDLLALFEIPNVFSAKTQRTLTSTSLHRVAALSSEKRVQFIHALPAFHEIWSEMHRLHQHRLHPDGRGAGGFPSPTPARAASPGSTRKTNRSYGHQHSLNEHASPFIIASSPPPPSAQSTRWEDFIYDQPHVFAASSGGTKENTAAKTIDAPGGMSVSIPSLGADVANASVNGTSRGVVVLRLTRGGPLEVSGATTGDTITHVDDTAVAGSFHLLDIMNEMARRLAGVQHQSPVCTVALIPAGRTHSLPVTVRLSLAS